MSQKKEITTNYIFDDYNLRVIYRHTKYINE